jgi:hypothetical protein
MRFARRTNDVDRVAPPRQWAVDIAVGAACLAVGAGGVLTLILSAALGTKSLWDEWWYLGFVAVFGALTLLGLYMLAAVYFPLPLPETRAARDTRAEFEIGEVSIAWESDGSCGVEIPVRTGRLDVSNVGLNILVPDFVDIHAWLKNGGPLFPANAASDHTSESLYADGRYQSNYWSQGGMQFHAFTAIGMVFRLSYESPVEPFPMEIRFTASALHGRVVKRATISLTSGRDGDSGTVSDEPTAEPSQNREVSVEPDALDASDAEGKE